MNMWTLLGFLTYLSMPSGYVDHYQLNELGTYQSEQECLTAGKQWTKKHKRANIEADYACEKITSNGDII